MKPVPGKWYTGDSKLPAVGTLCALDLGASEYRVAELRENENYDEDEDDEQNQWVWVDPDTGDVWEVDDVFNFTVLPAFE